MKIIEDKVKVKKRVHYVTNKELKKELEISQNQNEPTKQLHLLFYKMAKNIATKPCYNSYSNINDMINDAYMKCIVNYKKFNIKKPNPFSYFTSTINNTFLDCIWIEKRNLHIKEISKEQFIRNMYLKYGITYKNYI